MLRQAFYYDNRSNLTCVLDPEDGLTYFTFDAASRMTSVKNPWGQVAYYDYTPGGRLTMRVLGNGCVTYYGYDVVGQVEKIENRKGDLSVISSFAYQRDLLGNPVSIRREDGAVVYYEYDAKSQLTKETQRDPQGQTLYAWEWAYDPAGNRLWQVFNGDPTYYEYNAANELLTETTGAGTIYYDYDRCGNTVAKREPGGATTGYHWDYENLLRQVDLPGGAHNYFAYDADGKRVEKRDSAGTTRFTYQAGNMLALLQERNAGGDLTAHYTMGNGLEAMQRDTGQGIEEGSVSFFHYDALGSTFELTDEQQAVTDTYRYSAWGEVLDRTGNTDNPHMYVGNERYYWGQDLGLYMLGVRWYDQRVGRFVTVDPARDGVGWWLYALNDPPARVDPSGARCCPVSTDTSLGEANCETRFRAGHILCSWDYQASWTLTVYLNKGASNPDHCWVKQWVRERGRSWEADDAEGWPYPLTKAWRAKPGQKPWVSALTQSDSPGIHSTWLDITRASSKLYADFVTCLCTVERDHRCFRWQVEFEIRQGDEIACTATRKGTVKEQAAPGACVPRGSKATRYQ